MDSRIVTWAEVKNTVKALNPFIGNHVNTLPGVDQFELIETSYHFGEDIMKYGEFFIPYRGRNHHYTSPELPRAYADLLDYNWFGVPFGFVIENSTESHIALSTHLSPVRLLHPGGTFSLLTIFEPKTEPYFLYRTHSMKAGCRSLITLPKISHQLYNDRLAKKFNMNSRSLCPKTLDKQWEFFYDLSSAPEFKQVWKNKILFFSKPFIEHLEQQTLFKCSLLERVWNLTSYARSEYTYNLIWSMFINQYVSLAIRNTANVIENAKHCLRIALKQTPAFVPTVNNMPGPITGFIDALLNIYKIRYYLPIFMHINYYDGETPVYYSLQKPTFLNSFPQKSNANQTVIELEHIHNILRDFKEYVLSDQLPFSIRDSQLELALNKTEFQFYHPMGQAPICSNIQEIYQNDPRFLELISTLHPRDSLEFPINSIFFNGCIVIKPFSKEKQK